MRRRGLTLPTSPDDYLRLALIALVVPTTVGLAAGGDDWLMAAFRGPEAAMAKPFDFVRAILTAMAITWAAVLSSYWFDFSRSASLLAAAALCGLLIWPFIDARDFVGEIMDRYNRVRNIDLLFWRQRPESVWEGALLGFFMGLAWLGLERWAPRQAREDAPIA